jgi:hypothetical protein
MEIAFPRVAPPSFRSQHQEDSFAKENVRHDDPEDTSPQSHGKMSDVRIGHDPLNGKVGGKDGMGDVDKDRVRARILKRCRVPPLEHVDEHVHDRESSERQTS